MSHRKRLQSYDLERITCTYCGFTLEERSLFLVKHRVPGGDERRGVPPCVMCNRSGQLLIPREGLAAMIAWRRKIGVLP